MLPYWILFAVPAFASLFERPFRRLDRTGEYSMFIMAILMIGLIIGLRYKVGADWQTYVEYLLRGSYMKFTEISLSGDPGYLFLNWLVARLGFDVWLVNLICAGFFAWGLFAFAMVQPRPWLALVIAVPYLVVVVAMGYTRQGVAIGLAMRGLVSLGGDKSNLRFVFWVLVASLFHKSAVLLVPIAALAENRGRAWTICWVGAASVGAYFTLLESSVDTLMSTYVDAQYDSGGAAIRVAMNAAPAVLLLIFRDRFLFRLHERGLWLMIALVALALVPAVILSPSSTAVDRVGLYIIPLQLMVFSRLPDSFAKTEGKARALSLLVIIYSAGVQMVWLNFGTHAKYWLPYQLYPL
jgi:EpsG family